MQGLLLLNLGTPDDTSVPAVRRYLREFLSDRRVIDISPVGRWLLLNLVILPFRPAKSAEAYRKIWTEAGSPLLVHSRQLAAAVQARLGADWRVALAMRYGKPSVAEAFDVLQAAGCESCVVLPLYPQYASSTTGSSLEHVYRAAGGREVVPNLAVVPPFYDAPGFIQAAASVARETVAAADHVLFSYHGLPERQVRKTDPTGTHCLASETCCEVSVAANRHCYRHQCVMTSRALARALGLTDSQWSLSFQSRLGRTPWIRPYTEEVLTALGARKAGRLAVLCPSFTADCLETLEEIGIRGKETYLAAGGEDLLLAPCVNADAAWADAVVDLVVQTLGRPALAPPQPPSRQAANFAPQSGGGHTASS